MSEERSREFSEWWRAGGQSELCQLLYWVWDPIDLNPEFPDAVDQYDGYALEIATALASDIPVSAVAVLLGSIEQHRMGMAARQLEPIAARLRAWHERSMNRYRTRATAATTV